MSRPLKKTNGSGEAVYHRPTQDPTCKADTLTIKKQYLKVFPKLSKLAIARYVYACLYSAAVAFGTLVLKEGHNCQNSLMITCLDDILQVVQVLVRNRFDFIRFFFFFSLKVALQILGRKIYKNTENSSYYSQSLLFFFHRTSLVENHQTTRENRDLLRPRSTPTGNTVYCYMSSSLIYILKIHRRSSKHSV